MTNKEIEKIIDKRLVELNQYEKNLVKMYLREFLAEKEKEFITILEELKMEKIKDSLLAHIEDFSETRSW